MIMACMHPNASVTTTHLTRAIGVACAGMLWFGVTCPAWADRPTPNLETGQVAYLQSCARCHGLSGRGDGVDAKRFYPRPRDFALGVYKFRSTASGTPPTDEDLFQTITRGLPGSNMPDWQHLDEPVRWQLVSYLKSLSPIFQQTQPAPVKVANDPGPAHADRANGKALYEKLGCAACHGMSGRANGTSASGLVDDWGMPIRPADLTQGWASRGGSDPQSVMLRVLTGIDGAGMPSYADAISPEDAWHLAYYVTSLQETPHWNLVAHARRLEGALPSSVDDPRWAAAERTDVPVRNVVNASGEWSAPPTVKAVAVEVVYNDEAIAFRFTWDDPTQDPPAPPSEAARQAGRGTPHDGLALLLKPAGSHGDVVTLQAWPSAEAPPLDLCYWSADTGEVRETVAADFDGVIGRTAPHPVLVKSGAGYEDGRWRMVLQRPLAPREPEGAAVIALDSFTSMAMAVWDGGNPSARAVSPWLDLSLGSYTTEKQRAR